mgnify:CR=1 FL=1
MSEPIINLITPPDKLMNNNLSFLLVNPSDNIKEQFNEVAKNIKADINLYLFDSKEEQDWVIEVSNYVDYIIIDVDNVPSSCVWLIGYLLPLSKTFYLTSNNERPYNLISNNRVYDLRQIAEGEQYFVKTTEERR